MFNLNISLEDLTDIMEDFIEFCTNEGYNDIEDGVSGFLARENDRKSFEYLFRNYGYNQLQEWLTETENSKDKRLPR